MIFSTKHPECVTSVKLFTSRSLIKNQKNNMNRLFKLSFLFCFSLLFLQSCQNENKETPSLEPETEEKTPFDWMYNQRAYPHNQFDMTAYRSAVRQTQLAKQAVESRTDYEWELAGPINTGGRITDVVLHPTNEDLIYVGASVGGIWKSEDKGTTWAPIFENQAASSIGDMAISESNPNIMYVGTGEANGSATSGAFFGNGVYKTTNGGDTWTHVGLENSQHIGRMAVHPTNPNRAFAAAAGSLYGKNNDRGLYRTIDGGTTWEQVLFVSDSTSVIDVVIDKFVPNIMFAATWERVRQPWQRSYGGTTSGIWRSLDGGDTWEELSNGLPANNPNIGRIGLAMAQTQSGLIYASYTTNPITNIFEGVYRSSNSGTTWEKVDNDYDVENVFASFGWFFGNIRVSPVDKDELYLLGQVLMKSTDGGVEWEFIAQDNHVDNHGLEIHPQNPDFMVSGNDGGVYISQDSGDSWVHVETLPITQFYECEIDNSVPHRIYGGTQDNGTIVTLDGEIDNFQRILGGDGFHVLVNPNDNTYAYAEFQFGNLFRSDNGGNSYQYAFGGEDGDRHNWNTPVVFDPSNPQTLYYGADKLYRSTNHAVSWEAISGDLTDGEHPSGATSFGTISAIAVAPSNPDVIYVGTDDGNIQVTTIGGIVFTNISDGVPNRYVTEIAVDPLDENTVYATLSGYRYLEYQPHVLKSINGGQTWEDISGNLPEIPVNDIILDPDFADTYFIANDLGVWFTMNGGVEWEILDPSLPMTVVNDLDFHADTRTLLAATFGRSMYQVDLTDFVATTRIDKVDDFILNINPNPVSSQANIKLELPRTTDGILELFDLSGKKITTIAKGKFSAGKQTIEQDFSNLTNGRYIVRFASQEQILTKKIIVIH
jgi:photosystem II stability/assembly factor-like uncharacterized protein